MENNYSIPDLEKRVGCEDKFRALTEEFDGAYPDFDSSMPCLDALKTIKKFLAKKKDFRTGLFEGTKLRGSDCLTMAILEAVIAHNKGYTTMICRPADIAHYFHAALVYQEGDEQKTFKVTGRDYPFEPVLLGNSNIMLRLVMTKPFVDFVNRRIRRIY